MARRTGALVLFVCESCLALGAAGIAADNSNQNGSSGTAAVETVQARFERVRAHIDAGEFGPAIETAQTAANAKEQAQLLQLVADGQIAAGEFSAALQTAWRLPNSQDRVRARTDVARRTQFAGGASGANFGPLMQLIQQNTGGEPDGPWEAQSGEGGTMTPFMTGVYVNPHGLLYRLSQPEQSGRLASLGVKARVAALNEEMAKSSGLRFVSLTRLEQAVSARLRDGQPVLETMRHLAGLSQVRYVFVFPDERELIIAGPAEGWQYNANGIPVGVSSGWPTLRLDDLVTILRTFAPAGRGAFGCSINPRAEGLKSVKEFVEASQAQGPVPEGQLGRWLKEIQKRMGLQDIEVLGVPADTRVAQVLVEADYRMKLIGIGKLEGGKDIPSIFELIPLHLQKDPPPLDALRWWLTMKYDAVLHSPDRDVFEIQGSSVLVQSENQFVTAEGQHVPTGKAEDTNRLFAKNFTEHYGELAKRDPVFAELQNLFDLGMVAALCQHEHLIQRIDWDQGAFATTGGYRVEKVAPPKTVESVINHRVYHGRDIVVQVAGGVHADVLSAVSDPKLAKEAPGLRAVPKRSQRLRLPAAGRWWWDAAE